MRGLPGDQLLGCGVPEEGENGGIEEFGYKEGEFGLVEGLDILGGHKERCVHCLRVGFRDAGGGVGANC